MDNTLITPLGDIKPRAFVSEEKALKHINRVAVAIFCYTVFVIYPAYGVLRWLWLPDNPIVTVEGFITTFVVSVLFALFARRPIRNRVIDQVKAAP